MRKRKARVCQVPSLPDANQGKKIRRMSKPRSSPPRRRRNSEEIPSILSKSSQAIGSEEDPEESVVSPIHDISYGQSDSGVRRNKEG